MKLTDKEQPATLLMRNENEKDPANQEGLQRRMLLGLQCLAFISMEKFTQLAGVVLLLGPSSVQKKKLAVFQSEFSRCPKCGFLFTAKP